MLPPRRGGVAAAAALGLASLPSADAWASISQTKFATWLSDIQDEMQGIVSTSVQRQLGYLWTFPEDTLSNEGLGGGIGFAWDPKLFGILLPNFKEDMFYANWLGETDLRAAGQRAFFSWSANHKYLKFTDMSGSCNDLGYGADGQPSLQECPLVELYITSLNQTTQAAELAGGTAAEGEAAATAVPIAKVSSTFRYTNGEVPVRTVNGQSIPRDVIETYAGEISISRDLCWYLDSNFCARFHSLKNLGDPTTVQQVGIALLFTVWGIAVLGMSLRLVRSFRKQLSLGLSLDIKDRYHVFLEIFAKQSVMGTAVRLVVILIPWPFYTAIFVTCWDCYDFEAALTHEIGHILGLGHPNLVPVYDEYGYLTPGETVPGYTQYVSNVTNVYNGLFALGEGASRYPNGTTCKRLWDYVDGNLPPSTSGRNAINPVTGHRYSIMDSFTTHNPQVCITEDDLEAINTLYPVCEGAVVTPICDKSDINLGALRMVTYVIFPGMIALLLSICFHTSVHSKREKEFKQAKVAATWLRAGKLTLAGIAKEGGGGGGLVPAGRVAADMKQMKQADMKLAAAKASEVPSGIEVTVM